MYFLEAVSTSAGLIKPASTVSEMMREATEDSFLFNSKRSLTDWLLIATPSLILKHEGIYFRHYLFSLTRHINDTLIMFNILETQTMTFPIF